MTLKTLSMIFSQNKNFNYWIMPSVSNKKMTPKQRQSLCNEIIEKVCTYYGVSVKDVVGRTRFKEIVMARHMAIYIIRNKVKYKLKATGMLFNRDHTTVIHAIQNINNLLCYDEPTINDLKNLQNIL